MSTTTLQRNPWIVSARFDAVWFLLTPLLCAALVLPLRSRFDSQTILVFVMGLSSFGHHLPGFLRAYGDRELFRRFSLRFLLAPIVVYAVFVSFALAEAQGMMLLLMLWSVWHVGMQHFGFLRIYDAKRGIHDAFGARLDWIVSIAWFATIVLASPTYSHILVERMFAAGWTWLTPELFGGIRLIAWIIAGGASLVYVGHVARRLATGLPVSWIKLTLMVTTLLFLGYVWSGLGDIYLGLATWEIFHDLQYFALTWVYNRRLVDTGLARSGVMRAFFSPRRVLLYALAIPLYGSINLAILTTEGTGAFPYLMAFVLTSTFLHYYFDGFIWKVRQQRTRQGLSLSEGEAPEASASPALARRLAHAGLFLLPIGAIAAAESLGHELKDVEYYAKVAEITPRDPLAFTNLARAREEAGDLAGARAAYQRALEANPASAVALDGLAVLEQEAGHLRDARDLWQRAIEADPIYHVALRNYGTALLASGHVDESREYDARATAAARRTASYLFGGPSEKPAQAELPAQLEGTDVATAKLSRVHAAIEAQDRALAHRLLDESAGADPATFAYAKGRLHLVDAEFDQAIAELERALEELSGVPAVRETLANAYEAAGRFGEAADQRLALVGLMVDLPIPMRQALVRALVYAGRSAEAVEHLRILADGARDPSYDMMLAEILSTHPDAKVRNGREALQRAARVAEALGPDDPGGIHVWSLAAAEAGDFELASDLGRRAIDAAVRAGATQHLPKLEATLEEFLAGRAIRTGTTDGTQSIPPR